MDLNFLLPDFKNCYRRYTELVSGLPHPFFHEHNPIPSSLLSIPSSPLNPWVVYWFLWKITEEVKNPCLVHHNSLPTCQVNLPRGDKNTDTLRKAMLTTVKSFSPFPSPHSFPYLALTGWDPSLGPRALPFPGEFFLANAGDIEVVLWGTCKKSRLQKGFPQNSSYKLLSENLSPCGRFLRSFRNGNSDGLFILKIPCRQTNILIHYVKNNCHLLAGNSGRHQESLWGAIHSLNGRVAAQLSPSFIFNSHNN